MSIWRWLYTVLMYCLTPFFLLRLWWRGRVNPAYRQRIAERFGYVPRTIQPCLWVHAVSVGETIAARPLIERLLHEYPHHVLWVTTTTPTGSETVKRLFGGRVLHSYFPYDLPDAAARFLQRVRPSLLVVMETEIWPNLYAACAQRQIPLMLANARLSERSVQGYARIQTLVEETLANVSQIAARDVQDSLRFQQLGASPEQVSACGNIKFDLQVPGGMAETAQQLRQQWGANRPVWVAASTHAGEDETVLRVFAGLRVQVPELLLIVVPRHPERFDAVAKLCADTGLPTMRRSAGGAFSPETALIVGDSMGEMLLWYAAAEVAFIGGSLIPHGGHNPLEAAAFGVPVVSGEHVHNFTDMFPALCATGGAVLIRDGAALQGQLLHWLQAPYARHTAGIAAQTFFHQNQGALERLIQHIHRLLN